MRRNHDKNKAMVLGTTTEVPAFMCENISIAVEEQIDLLSITVDNKLKFQEFESHIAKICRKVSQHVALLYLSVSTRAVIGQFCGPYFTVRPANFESFFSRAPN